MSEASGEGSVRKGATLRARGGWRAFTSGLVSAAGRAIAGTLARRTAMGPVVATVRPNRSAGAGGVRRAPVRAARPRRLR